MSIKLGRAWLTTVLDNETDRVNIHYAQNWQVLSVICSYAAFIFDVLLVITLIIFFIKY